MKLIVELLQVDIEQAQDPSKVNVLGKSFPSRIIKEFTKRQENKRFAKQLFKIPS